MEGIFNLFRKQLSADKRRFSDGYFDLDLSYITERIIAMSYPAEGMESTYRNYIIDVAGMLDHYHEHHYRIYNLTEREYETWRFHHRVVECGWWDHHGPPLAHLLHICIDMYEYLEEHSKNVVVVHCLAGKGRTGTVIAAFLLFCGLFTCTKNALTYFAHQRSTNNWGVAQPSQRRYVEYLERMLFTPDTLNPAPLVLHSVTMFTIPGFDLEGNGCMPFVEVFSTSNRAAKKLLFTSEEYASRYFVESDDPGDSTSFLVDVALHGDIQIVLKHKGLIRNSSVMGRCQFNTGMLLSRSYATFSKLDVDDACKDARFTKGFSLLLQFDEIITNPEHPFDGAGRFRCLNTWDRFGADRKEYALHIKSCDYDESSRTDWKYRPDRELNGTICFRGDDNEKAAKARKLDEVETTPLTERGGWLNKQGAMGLKQWRQRWFVLKPQTLAYFKTPKYTTPQGTIPLKDILNVSVNADSTTFEIVTHDRVYNISANDEQEREEWVDAIDQARGALDQVWEIPNHVINLTFNQANVKLCGLRLPQRTFNESSDPDSWQEPHFAYYGVFKLEDQIVNAESGELLAFHLNDVLVTMHVVVIKREDGFVLGELNVDFGRLVLKGELEVKRWFKLLDRSTMMVKAEALLFISFHNSTAPRPTSSAPARPR